MRRSNRCSRLLWLHYYLLTVLPLLEEYPTLIVDFFFFESLSVFDNIFGKIISCNTNLELVYIPLN